MRTLPFRHPVLRKLRSRQARVAATIAFLEQLIAMRNAPPGSPEPEVPPCRRVLPFSRKEPGELSR